MFKLDEDAIQEAIIDRAAEQLVGDMEGARGLIRESVDRRIDKVFADTAEALIKERIDAAFTDALNREYFQTDSFGQRAGEATTLSAQLDRIVSTYWSERVDRGGNKSTSSYHTTTRAEYLMAQICAKDFSEQMKQAAVSVTAALKDGFRAQMASHVDALLDELFRVKSLQDQGKATKPW